MPDPTEVPNTDSHSNDDGASVPHPDVRPTEGSPKRSTGGGPGSRERDEDRTLEGNAMPGVDETNDDDTDNERLKIIHDPTKTKKDLDAYTDHVNGIEPEDKNPDNAIAPKSWKEDS